jgi:hypothetical protein
VAEAGAVMKLYHYTCDHRVAAIRDSRWLMPHKQVQFPHKPLLIWLTDMEVPDRFGLGLTSYSLGCDRTHFRVTASAIDHEVTHWPAYARGLAGAARRVVEAADGVLPMHWWVAEVPLPVVAVEAVP